MLIVALCFPYTDIYQGVVSNLVRHVMSQVTLPSNGRVLFNLVGFVCFIKAII